jgi:O-antigen ligase
VLNTLVLNQRWSFRDINYRLAQIFLWLSVMALPFGVGYINTLLLSAVAFTLLSGHWREKLEMLRSQKTTRWVLEFMAVILFGVLYSAATSKHAWGGFSKYDKILFFIAYLPLITEQKFRHGLINAFLVSALISVLIIIGGFDSGDPLINPIDSSFIVGVASFILLRKCLEGGQWRWLQGALFVFLGTYLLFYNIERSGYLIFFGLLGTVFWQYFRWRGLLVGLSLILSLILSLYWLSPVFQQRLDRGYAEAKVYISTESKTSQAIGRRLGLITDVVASHETFWDKKTNDFSLYAAYQAKQGLLAEKRWLLNPHADLQVSSIGLRLGFMQYSWREIQKHPWFGNGTGSFAEVYGAGGGPRIDENLLGHPHNEYILVWFQWGIFGLIIFLLWQLAMWVESFRLPKKEQFLLQGLLVCFALLGFCNATLYVNPTGDVFVILATVSLSAKNHERGHQWTLR